MCLRSVWSLKDREEFINKIDEDEIKVYKVVAIEEDGYYPVAKKTKIGYKDGPNEAISSTISIGYRSDADYVAGFHFYQLKKDAELYLEYLQKLVADTGWYQNALQSAKDEGETVHKRYKIVECIVKKEWITMIGQEPASMSSFDGYATVIVAEKATFPEFIKTS